MKITLKTLTPLWTGGVDGTSDRVHETGIIGSLRWWYEAIVRGLGHNACDPTGDGKCIYNARKSETPEEQLCPACYIFGATGWKRRFRLDASCSGKIPFGLLTLDSRGQFNHWWLASTFEDVIGTKLPFGELTLRLSFNNLEAKSQLLSIISLMSSKGALGARTQYGFGQFVWENTYGDKEAILHIQAFLEKYPQRTKGSYPPAPTVNDLWVSELKFEEDYPLVQDWLTQGHWVGKRHDTKLFLPVSFDIRYKHPDDDLQGLRENFRQMYFHEYGKHKAKLETKKVFGFSEGENKLRSRVFVSHLFRAQKDDLYSLRIWGFTSSEIAREINEGVCEMFGIPKDKMVFKIFKQDHGQYSWENERVQG